MRAYLPIKVTAALLVANAIVWCVILWPRWPDRCL